MFRYNALTAPAKDAWLALDEQERLSAVLRYHGRDQMAADKAQVHAAMHVTVENQLAMGEKPSIRALDRLMADGLDRHDAVHAIASVFAAHLHDMMTTGAPYSAENYARELDKLTAQTWRENFRAGD